MEDKTITYTPPHCEDIANTLTNDEFDALITRLITARGKRPQSEQQQQVSLADTTQPPNTNAPQPSPRGED